LIPALNMGVGLVDPGSASAVRQAERLDGIGDLTGVIRIHVSDDVPRTTEVLERMVGLIRSLGTERIAIRELGAKIVQSEGRLLGMTPDRHKDALRLDARRDNVIRRDVTEGSDLRRIGVVG